MPGVTLDAFAPDQRKRWLVERGIKKLAEASRRLPDDLKVGILIFPGRRWPELAMCRSMITSASRMTYCGAWCRMTPQLEKICRQELSAELDRERQKS
jgi:hypothetical protein